MGACAHQRFFFFDTFFALFSILLGNYDGFGSMQSNIWCDFLLQFCHFLKKLRNSICYGHFWAAHGVMSIGVYLRPPVHRNSMKRQGHTKKISSFAFTLSILANCDTKIIVLAFFNRFTIDRNFQRCHCGSWSHNWHQIDVLYGGILDVFQMVRFNVMLTSKWFAMFCMRSYKFKKMFASV